MSNTAAATEYTDYTAIGGSYNIQTNSNYYQAANTRYAIQPTYGADDTSYLELASASISEAWIHGCVYISTGNATNRFLKIYSGGTQRIGIAWATGDAVTISKWNGSAWTILATSGTGALPSVTRSIIDVRVKIGNPGIISVYVNGSPVVSDNTQDITWSGVTGFDKVRLQSMGTVASYIAYYSEMIMADWNTIGSRVVSRVPDAQGTYTAWTGTYLDIDDTNGGTDQILSGTAGQRESWTHTDYTALAAGESIAMVGMSVAANRDAAGPQSFNMFTRISATDYDQPSETVNVATGSFIRTWTVSPATSSAWSVTELNAAEFGVKSVT